MFYIVARDSAIRDSIINRCRQSEVHPVFHYLSLHKSTYYVKKHDGRPLHNSDRYSDSLLRLPFYYTITEKEIQLVTDLILN
jgi:dTDP-4-amino-4,6-dideoxygalactose transaminase